MLGHIMAIGPQVLMEGRSSLILLPQLLGMVPSGCQVMVQMEKWPTVMMESLGFYQLLDMRCSMVLQYIV